LKHELFPCCESIKIAGCILLGGCCASDPYNFLTREVLSKKFIHPSVVDAEVLYPLSPMEEAKVSHENVVATHGGAWKLCGVHLARSPQQASLNSRDLKGSRSCCRSSQSNIIWIYTYGQSMLIVHVLYFFNCRRSLNAFLSYSCFYIGTFAVKTSSDRTCLPPCFWLRENFQRRQ